MASRLASCCTYQILPYIRSPRESERFQSGVALSAIEGNSSYKYMAQKSETKLKENRQDDRTLHSTLEIPGLAETV